MWKLVSSGNRILLSRIAAFVVVAYVLFSRPPYSQSPAVQDLFEVIGLTLLATAAFGRIWCLVYIGGKTKRILMTDGPYSMVRNPLYVFSFIGVVGFGLTVGNPILTALLAVVFGVYYSFVARKEERKLASLFGTEFEAYMARTPRWLPNFKLFVEPETMTIHPIKIRKGLLDATWFVWAFLFWELLEYVRMAGFWPYGK